MRLAALLIIVAVIAAGCTTSDSLPPDTRGDPTRAVFVDPITDDHDHADVGLHALSTPSLARVAFNSLGGGGATFASFAEIDLFEDVAVVSAVLQGDTPRGAIVMVDLSDPAAPKRLGFATIADAAHPLDVKFDEKGEYVYASASGQIFAFDVRDRAAPQPRGAMLPTGSACHMSALGVVADVEYFFCTGDPVGLSVYRVMSLADARVLVPVGRSDVPGGPDVSGSPTRALGAPHDMTFQHDPVTGDPILVVSNRGFGVRILDVRDPTNPVQLGRWHGEGADYFSDHLHTAMVTVVNGTRYVIVSPEILTAGTPPAIWFLDATDYRALDLVAEWTAPNDHPSPGFTFTTHQWQVAEGRIYLGYYHAGVWVLDIPTILDTPFRDDPSRAEVLGYYLPHEPPVIAGSMTPNVWDVTLRNGLMFVTDINGGLYVLHYVPDEIGDTRLTGFS